MNNALNEDELEKLKRKYNFFKKHVKEEVLLEITVKYWSITLGVLTLSAMIKDGLIHIGF